MNGTNFTSMICSFVHVHICSVVNHQLCNLSVTFYNRQLLAQTAPLHAKRKISYLSTKKSGAQLKNCDYTVTLSHLFTSAPLSINSLAVSVWPFLMAALSSDVPYCEEKTLIKIRQISLVWDFHLVTLVDICSLVDHQFGSLSVTSLNGSFEWWRAILWGEGLN